MNKAVRFTGNPARASKITPSLNPPPIDRTIGDLCARAALFQPATYDEAALTVEAVASTFANVVRRDKGGAFLERLDPAGLDTTDLNGAPLLDSHRQGNASDVIGIITGHRFEEGKLVVTLRLSLAEDAQPAIQRIREGTLRGVSIGYKVTQWAETTEEIAGRKTRVRTAVAWSIHEASAVAVPADPAAKFRSSDPMALDTTDERGALIARVRAAHDLPQEWATRMADAADELTDDEIRADGRETALAARAARPQPQIRTAAPSNADPSVILERQAEAMAARMMGTAPSEAARPFMALGLHDLARDALTRSGQSVAMLGREEVMTRAMHTTSDFPELLTASGNRVLSAAYQRAQSPLKQLARQRTASDFRALSVLKLGEFSGLQKVSEAGEIKAMTTGEAKESYALETFGGIFSLTRKAIINDDLGAFARWGEMMGAAAAETEAKQLLALLTANSGGGVKMDDGKNLFHADHGNLAPSGLPLNYTATEDPLSDARLALRKQTGLDGKTPINAVPKYLLVSPENETAAERVLSQVYAPSTGDVNAMAGKMQVLVEPRLTGLAWYVFADPALAPVLEYAYLSSASGPQLSSRDGWETLGREFRVTLDFGAGAVDHRGAYRNAGA